MIDSNSTGDAMSHTENDNPVPPDAAEGEPLTDEPVEDAEPGGRIGWRKALVIVVAFLTVWTIVQSRRYTSDPIEWPNDLEACLRRAQDPPKAIVLLVHKRDCPVMAELETTVFALKSTRKWARGGIPCRLIWEEHPEVVKRYRLTESPTLLCLNPKGEAVPTYRWSGLGITGSVYKRYLKYIVGHKDEGTYRKQPSTTGPAGESR